MTDDLRKLAEIQGRVGTHDATCPLAVIPHDWTDHSSLPLCDCGNRDRVCLLDRIAALEMRLKALVEIGPPEDYEYGNWGCCNIGHKGWMANRHSPDCPWAYAKAALAAAEKGKETR